LGAPNPNFALQIRGNRKQFWGDLLMEDGRPSGGLPSLKIWERSDKKWGEKLEAQFWSFKLLITPALSSTRKTLGADDEKMPFRHVHFLPILQAGG